MNFEETVKYIKVKLDNADKPIRFKLPNWTDWVLIKNVEISKDGKFHFYYHETHLIINLFELKDSTNGIYSDQDMLYFLKRGGSFSSFWVYSITDAERLTKAFLHLKTLCTKEKDPFDN